MHALFNFLAFNFLISLLFPLYSQALIDPELLLSQLTLDEKIGQLFMVAALSSEEENLQFKDYSPYQMDADYIESLIVEYKIGGIIFLGAGFLKEQCERYHHFQEVNAVNKVPLWFGQDGEWGPSMRLKDAVRFPRNMTLGALCEDDDYLIRALGNTIAEQFKRLGLHINFAPVVDINNNPLNPVINDRSFGENKERVKSKARLYMLGMQQGGIYGCAKHFPGHGDTDIDSHEDLPIIPHSRARLNELELAPFQDQIAAGVHAIMLAHLMTPALDEKMPTSLSYKVATDLLQKELDFHGLIFTDGLGMKALTKHFDEGEIELQALLAGADILLCPVSVPQAVIRIKEKIERHELTEEELDARVLKILKAKNELVQNIPYYGEDIYNQFNFDKAYLLKKELYARALTLVKNDGILPLAGDEEPIVIQIGGSLCLPDSLLQEYGIKNRLVLSKTMSQKELEHAEVALQSNERVIITVLGMNKFVNQQFGLSDDAIRFITKASTQAQVIVCLFGSPYSLRYFGNESAIVVAYEDDPAAQEACFHALFGGVQFCGKLPVTASSVFPEGFGLID